MLRKRALAISILGTLTMFTSAFAESPKSTLENFGVLGTWSTDCAITPAKNGRPVGVFTFDAPFIGMPTLTTAFYGGNVVQTFRWAIQSASQVTIDKMTMAVAIDVQTVNDQPIHFFEAAPFQFAPIIKNGNRLETKMPQALKPILLEKCLN